MQETSGNGLCCVSMFYKLGTESAGYIKTQVMWLRNWFTTCNSWWFAWFFELWYLRTIPKSASQISRYERATYLPSKYPKQKLFIATSSSRRRFQRDAFTKFIFGQWHFFGASQCLCKENVLLCQLDGWVWFDLAWAFCFDLAKVPCGWEMGIFLIGQWRWTFVGQHLGQAARIRLSP